VRSALLRGRDHTELGAIGLVAEGPAAIAISKGGAQKTYSHVDPNEDAACFAIGPAGLLVAVADGHDGASGAEVTLRTLLEECAEAWTAERSPASSDEQWSEVACEALSTLNSAVLRDAAERRADAAPTTFSVALVRPREGLLLHASIGDSHVFEQREVATDLGWATLERSRAYFLGYESQGAEGMREKSVVGCTPLAGVSAVVLATDGVSERAIGFADPARAVGEVFANAQRGENPELRAAALSRGITEATIAEHQRNRAGDNIANGVLWLG
jgi:hypothetical protein